MVETRFHVGMTCEGCAAAVKRILGKVEGVTEIDTNVAEKAVIVQADESVTPEMMLEKLQKWGQAAGNPSNWLPERVTMTIHGNFGKGRT